MKALLKAPRTMILPVLLLLLLVGLAPFLDAGFTSFFHDLYGERWFAGLSNYQYFAEDRAFSYSLNITVAWAVANTLLVLILGFYLASVYVLQKSRLIRQCIFSSLLIPWAVPVYILVPIWRALIHGNGGISLLTHLFGLEANLMTDPAAGFLGSLFVSVWMGLPIAVLVFTGALKKISRSVLDAAQLDGAGEAALVRFIFFPFILRSILVIAILDFVKSFKEFSLLYLMTAGGPPLVEGITERYIVGATTTLGIFLYDLFNETDDFGIVSAYSIVMAGLVILVMFLWFLLRNRERGLSLRILFVAVIQVLFSGPSGLIFTGLYTLSLWKRRFFFYSFLLQAAWTGLSIVNLGFLEGFSPGIIFSFFVLLSIPGILPRGSGGYPNSITVTIYHFFRISLPILMILSGLLVLYMLLWMSFSGISLAYADSFLPPFFTTGSYRTVLFEEQILHYFGNTLLVSGITAFFIPFMAFSASVFLVSRGRSTTHGFLTMVQVLSIAGGMHSLIPLYSVFRKIGLINSFAPLVLIYLYHAVPFSLFTITAYLEQLPRSLGDQARIEGVSPLRYTVSILLPLSLPVITTSVMTAFLAAWNGFMAPLLFLNDDSKYTISVKLFTFAGSIASGNPQWNLFAAASVLNCLIVVGIFTWLRKPVATTSLADE